MDFLIEFLGQNASILFAAGALLFGVYQWRGTKAHNRISTNPALTSVTDTSPDSSQNGVWIISAKLLNHGLGPAKIGRFQILIDDEIVEVDSPDSLRELVVKHIDFPLLSSYFFVPRAGYVMAKEQSLDLAKLTFVVTIHRDVEDLKEQLKRFNVRVEYESSYGERMEPYDSRNPKDSPKSRLSFLKKFA